MSVINKSEDWDTAWLEVVTGWALKRLGCTGDYQVTYCMCWRRPVYKGRAWAKARRVKVWLNSQHCSRPMPAPDPRVPEILEWLRAQPELRSTRELLVWILGHELWHTVDPYSCREHLTRRKHGHRFVEMERRCDEAGFKLVEAFRVEEAALEARAAQRRCELTRADRLGAAVRQAATMGTSRLAALRRAQRE